MHTFYNIDQNTPVLLSSIIRWILLQKLCTDNAKHAINLKSNQANLNVGDFYFTFQSPLPLDIGWFSKKQFLLEYSVYLIIRNVECVLFNRHFYLPQKLLLCQNNAAANDTLFTSYYFFNKIIFDYLKACHQI